MKKNCYALSDDTVRKRYFVLGSLREEAISNMIYCSVCGGIFLFAFAIGPFYVLRCIPGRP